MCAQGENVTTIFFYCGTCKSLVYILRFKKVQNGFLFSSLYNLLEYNQKVLAFEKQSIYMTSLFVFQSNCQLKC